MATKQL